MGKVSTTTEKEIMSKYNLLDIDVLKVVLTGVRPVQVLNVLENSKIYRTY